MPLLLDTHILIWLANDPQRLSSAALNQLNSKDNLYLSYASVWEIAIKSSINKITLDRPVKEFVDLAVYKHSLVMLPISLAHIYHTQNLPLHHRDPFDRMIISQATLERLPIVSSDAIFDAYAIERMW